MGRDTVAGKDLLQPGADTPQELVEVVRRPGALLSLAIVDASDPGEATPAREAASATGPIRSNGASSRSSIGRTSAA